MDRRMNKLVLLVGFFSLVLLAVQPVQAQSPTPVPAGAAQPAFTLPWYVGAIILVAVVVGVTFFKERLQAKSKKPVISTNCCLPLVEDGTSPFKPEDEEAESKA